jgi:hypothetical protein
MPARSVCEAGSKWEADRYLFCQNAASLLLDCWMRIVLCGFVVQYERRIKSSWNDARILS